MSHVGSNGVEGVDLAGRIGADFAMALLGPVAQFADIAQHQHLAPGKTFEQVDGGIDRRRVGVVGVIDHAHAVGRQLRDRAALDRLHRAQPGGDTEQRHAQGVCSSGSGQGVGNVVVAQQVQLHVFAALRSVQGKGRATTGIHADVGGVEISRRVQHGKREHLAPGSAYTPGLEGFVVEVQYRRARRIETFKDFALGFDDFFRATELADVGGTGIVDDCHVGLGQRHGVGDFADARGTQFDHGRRVFRGQFEQSQRCPEIIVQVATSGQHRPARAQDAGEQFLDCGFAAGAGDGCNRLVKGSTVQRAQLAEGQAGVGDQQLRQGGVRHFALHQGTHGAFGGDVIKVVVAVETRPGQRHKQLARLDVAAVDTHAIEAAIARQYAGRQRLGQFAELHRFKHERPPRQSGRDRPRPDRRTHGVRR